MKTVMHEASSIAQAIEQAWVKAGQPHDFSIKILEYPEKNFLGFTKRSAKVALFFDDPRLYREHNREHGAQITEAKKQPSMAQPVPKGSEQKGARGGQHRPLRDEKKVVAQQQRVTEHKPQWNQAMIDCVRSWLNEVLLAIGVQHVNFTIEPSDFHLRIIFHGTVIADQGKERKLFASFAMLILETLKKKFRTGLKGHKLVLIHTLPHDVQ